MKRRRQTQGLAVSAIHVSGSGCYKLLVEFNLQNVVSNMVTTSVTLLDRFRDPQDAQAWARFVDLYSPLILKWIRSCRVRDSDCADVLQEVFVTLARKLPTFEYDATRSFGAWLRTVTVNKCRSFLRHHKQGLPLHGDVSAAVDDPAVEFQQAEYRSHLSRRALELMQTEFEETTWQACWESVVEDRPAREIANELGITPNAVYLAKGRVLRRLREELNGLWE